MDDQFWVSQIDTHGGLTFDHITQFATLWEILADIQLNNDVPDKIVWKLTQNGSYSSKSAYNMQFLGQTSSTMPALVWKPCPPPLKCKIFAWLILQNRVWSADRLERRGWKKLWPL